MFHRYLHFGVISLALGLAVLAGYAISNGSGPAQLLGARAALAQGMHGHGNNEGGGDMCGSGPGFMFGCDSHTYGEVTAIDGDTLTIVPRIPAMIAEKMAEHGIEHMGDLPAEFTITVTDDTKIFINGDPGEYAGITLGMTIAALGTGTGDTSMEARIIGDQVSFEKHMADMHARMKEHMAGMKEHGLPVFGEIIAMDDKGVTIRTEVPAFIQEKLDKHNINITIDVPDQVTLLWGEDMHFMSQGEMLNENPFVIGDRVAAMATGKLTDAERTLIGMGDYDSARMKMEEHHRKMKECHEGGQH